MENGLIKGVPGGVELRPIAGVIGYAAGSDGHVYSFKRKGSSRGSGGRYQTTARMKGYGRTRRGHLSVRLFWRGEHQRLVHRVIAESFHGPCPEGMECSHLNGDPSDNRPANLKWETPSKNCLRKNEHGTMNAPRGERNGQSRLTWDAVEDIRSSTDTLGSLGGKYGVTPSTVWAAKNGKTWRGHGG